MQLFILQTFITLHSPFSFRPENDTSSCHDTDEKLQSLPSGHLPICGGSKSSISDLCISPSCKDILLLFTAAVFPDWGRCSRQSFCVVNCSVGVFVFKCLGIVPGWSARPWGTWLVFWLELNECPQNITCGQQRPMVSLALLHLAPCGRAKDHTQGFRCAKCTVFHSTVSSAWGKNCSPRDSVLPSRQSPFLDQIYPCLDLNESLSAGTCRLRWPDLCIKVQGSCSYLLRFLTTFKP